MKIGNLKDLPIQLLFSVIGAILYVVTIHAAAYITMPMGIFDVFVINGVTYGPSDTKFIMAHYEENSFPLGNDLIEWSNYLYFAKFITNIALASVIVFLPFIFISKRNSLLSALYASILAVVAIRMYSRMVIVSAGIANELSAAVLIVAIPVLLVFIAQGLKSKFLTSKVSRRDKAALLL